MSTAIIRGLFLVCLSSISKNYHGSHYLITSCWHPSHKDWFFMPQRKARARARLGKKVVAEVIVISFVWTREALQMFIPALDEVIWLRVIIWPWNRGGGGGGGPMLSMTAVAGSIPSIMNYLHPRLCHFNYLVSANKDFINVEKHLFAEG